MTEDCKGRTGREATVRGAADYRVVKRTRDGRAIVIRAIRPQDKPLLREAFAKLEEQTIRRRFFGTKKELSEQELQWAAEVDFANHVALVAVIEERGEETIIAVGRFVGKPCASPGAAEVAFVVEEDYQSQGIASLLLRHLATIARENGIRRFVAEVSPENRPMLDVFERCGLPMQVADGGDSLRVSLDLSNRSGNQPNVRECGT